MLSFSGLVMKNKMFNSKLQRLYLPFKLGLILTGKARSLPLRAAPLRCSTRKALALLANIRLVWKGLQGTSLIGFNIVSLPHYNCG
jgi:hypothetical protein